MGVYHLRLDAASIAGGSLALLPGDPGRVPALAQAIDPGARRRCRVCSSGPADSNRPDRGPRSDADRRLLLVQDAPDELRLLDEEIEHVVEREDPDELSVIAGHYDPPGAP